MAEVDRSDAKIQFFTSLVKGKKVLDLGVVQHDLAKYEVGTWLHRAIVEASKDCTGLDIDEEGVKFLQNKGYKVVHGDAQDFDLDEKFEVIVAGDLIEHLSNFEGFLSSVSLHLKSGGKFSISTPNPFWWRHAVKILFRGSAEPHPQHTCWFCDTTLTQLLNRNGFLVEEVHYNSIYDLSTLPQRITRLATRFLWLPDKLKYNTIMMVAKKLPEQ